MLNLTELTEALNMLNLNRYYHVRRMAGRPELFDAIVRGASYANGTLLLQTSKGSISLRDFEALEFFGRGEIHVYQLLVDERPALELNVPRIDETYQAALMEANARLNRPYPELPGNG